MPSLLPHGHASSTALPKRHFLLPSDSRDLFWLHSFMSLEVPNNILSHFSGQSIAVWVTALSFICHLISGKSIHFCVLGLFIDEIQAWNSTYFIRLLGRWGGHIRGTYINHVWVMVIIQSYQLLVLPLFCEQPIQPFRLLTSVPDVMLLLDQVCIVFIFASNITP